MSLVGAHVPQEQPGEEPKAGILRTSLEALEAPCCPGLGSRSPGAWWTRFAFYEIKLHGAVILAIKPFSSVVSRTFLMSSHHHCLILEHSCHPPEPLGHLTFPAPAPGTH